ncbi:MAG: hypothetical protein HC902_07395 [Calothrix sp. SM1_5_4]|nr:hypothetical protein [Calothrix sp. SM1_5_4]
MALSFLFFISSALNFILAWDIFRDIDATLDPAAKDQILNEQIAQMTWMGFVVIALPLMVFSGTLVYLFLKGVSRMTETPIHSLIKS